MNTIHYYIGIDVSDKTFDVAVITAPDSITTTAFGMPNTTTGFRDVCQHLKDNGIPISASIVTMESTGVYSDRLSHYLYEQGFTVCVEPPQKVKKAFTEKPKTDPVDAGQIAEYGFRFRDKLHQWEPPSDVLERIKTLLTLRDLLKKASAASMNARRAWRHKHRVPEQTVTYTTTVIKHLSATVRDIEREMRRELQHNPGMYQITMNLTTMPGVGFLLAVNMAVLTDGFTRHVNHRELSAYVGMCPYPHQSGTSVYQPPTSDGAGPPRVRRLLYLAAMSARQHHPELKQYYERKRAQGKPGKVVMNNVANKLLKMMCAMILSGKPYLRDYRSQQPTRNF
jgi:transposase